jgi:HK97 family phage major capsid protein
MTATEMNNRLGSIEKALHGLAQRGDNRPDPRTMFGGYGAPTEGPGWEKGWPVGQLKERFEKAYGGDPHVHMLSPDHRGRPRGLGMGPAYVAIAAAAGHPTPLGKVSHEGIEKAHGFYTVQKAASHGIPTRGGQVRKVALAESSGTAGGYVIPPQYQSELLTLAAEDGFIEEKCKSLPMTGRSVEWPMLDITTAQSTGTSPYFGGVLATWQPEAVSYAETEPAFRLSTWTAWDLTLYAVASNQLLADNGIGLDALLTQLFSQAVTWYKEYAFLTGTGSGAKMPLGILNAPATILQSRSAPGQFRLADAAAMMSRLHVRSWDSACWIMHQSVLPQMLLMTANAASGDRLVNLSPIGDGKYGGAVQKFPKVFLNGLPIYFTEKLPTLGTTGDVVLVDWSQYVIGNRMELQIDVSPHFLFRTNQMAWRVIARCDGKPWLNNSITDANGWTSSPFVVLRG